MVMHNPRTYHCPIHGKVRITGCVTECSKCAQERFKTEFFCDVCKNWKDTPQHELGCEAK